MNLVTGRITLFQKNSFDSPEILHRFKLDALLCQHSAGKFEVTDFDCDMRLGELMIFEDLNSPGPSGTYEVPTLALVDNKIEHVVVPVG